MANNKISKAKLLLITKTIKDNLERNYNNYNFNNVRLSKYNDNDAREISIALQLNKSLENYIASKFKITNEQANTLIFLFNNAITTTHSFSVTIINNFIYKNLIN